MRRLMMGAWIALFVGGSVALGAAPAAPSYEPVLKVIQTIRDEWAAPGSPPHANAPGWNALFAAIERDFSAYAAAKTEDESLVALNRIYEYSDALRPIAWGRAVELRESIRTWLRPRVRLAWAGRRLVESVQGLPAAPTPDVRNNRERWLSFVKDDLGESLLAYDGAETVAQRAKGLDGVLKSLDALQDKNRSYVWGPSQELQRALDDLYNQPNLDVSADASTLSPLFNTNLVTSGPVYRKGYVSQVTAGPKTGFGLMHSDDGIAFYNSQLLSSVTPIWDFQQQVASDQKGQRAAKMYQFNMTTTDQQQLTVVAVIRTNGLSLYPSFTHNVNAYVSSSKQPGGHLPRTIASLVGFNQDRITEEVREGALPEVRQSVPQEAYEQALENTSAEAAQRNAVLRQYLVGFNRLVFQNVLIEGLSLRSRPENALIGGLIQYLGAPGQRGADMPQPADLYVPAAGISADLHLTSVLSNFARGFLNAPEAQGVENLLVRTNDVPAGTPPGDAFSITRNVDDAAFLEAVEEAQAANNPKVLALRVKKPTQPPDVGADRNGNLVLIIRDFQVELPAPPQKEGQVALMRNQAKAYRITSPAAEVSLSFQVQPDTPGGPLKFKGKVEGLDLGPQGRVFGLNGGGTEPQQMNAFLGNVVIGLVRVRLQGQEIDVPLNNLPLQGFAVQGVSPLDPSGWIRANLVRVGNAPLAFQP